MLATGNTRLVEYGIHTESSDWRAHVCVNAGKVYVFPTRLAAELVKSMVESGSDKIKSVKTTVQGSDVVTAVGVVFRADEIPRVTPVGAKWLIDKMAFSPSDSTSVKGEKAVNVVRHLLNVGWFPLPWSPKLIDDVDMQVSGLDIVVTGSHKIQVKCDYRGGISDDPLADVTGNLFLQFAECNPLHAV